MEFSPALPCSSWLARWSPDGAMLAHAVGARVVVRDAKSLKVVSSHCCLSAVDALFWSPTSEFVGASIVGMAVTHIFCPSNESWTAKISEGPIGLSWCRFSPDGRHVLSQSEFNVKLTIWSLSSKQVRYVKFAQCLDFSPDGSRMAVAEKSSSDSSSANVVAVYGCSDWREVCRFPTLCAEASGLAWQPRSGEKLAVWNGAIECLFQVFASSGRLLYTHRCDGLGVRCLSWSPCGQLIVSGAVGRTELSVFNALNCTHFADLDHPDQIGGGEDFATADCAVFEETVVPPEDVDGRIIQEWLNSRETVFEAVAERPFTLPCSKTASAPAQVPGGVSEALFSPDGRHLATREEGAPRVAWIWDLQEVRLASVLVHKDPVTCLSWEPAGQTRLAALTSGCCPCLFLWSPLGAVVLRMPTSTSADPVCPTRVRWNPRGCGAMCLVARDGLVCSKIATKRKKRSSKQGAEQEEEEEEKGDVETERTGGS